MIHLLNKTQANRMPLLWLIVGLSFAPGADRGLFAQQTPAGSTSTPWRDDVESLVLHRELMRAYEYLPFSHKYEGVLDACPFQLDWQIGPNVPIAWKGGVAGVFGDEIVLVGGLWMPGRENLAYTYNIKKRTYRKIPPPPQRTAYTQGCYDGKNLYVIGGRSTGRKVYRLNRPDKDAWKWTELPDLPESDRTGRWLATTGVVPGKWLFLVSGHPAGTPSSNPDQRRLPDWRLRLDKPDARWEPMAAYPGGKRHLVTSAVVRGKFYVFGGSDANRSVQSMQKSISEKYGITMSFFESSVCDYRDAYCYDPESDKWSRRRGTAFAQVAGAGVVLEDRYILLMGSSHPATFRVGKSNSDANHWMGLGDRILCYDVQEDNYSRVGLMVYGVATSPWVTDGKRVYGFGGEPRHGYNLNTENVLQIGTIRRR